MKIENLFLFSLAGSVLLLTTMSAVRAADAAGEGLAAVKQAVAVLHPTANNKCHGVVRFTQDGDAVKVVADLEGINPGQKHACHIQQYVDCAAADAMSASNDYNPEGHQHG